MSSKLIWIIVSLLIVAGMGYLYQTIPQAGEIRTVNMIDNNGDVMGTVRLSETGGGVLLDLDIKGLTPNGEHAIHVHETGKCTPLDSFKDSGGHYNPTEHKHGLKHPEGSHAGDMPNLKPDAKGVIKTGFVNTKLTLGESSDKRSTVFDEDGSAIIIHAGADDHMSQPSGAAGARISCGIIQ